MRQEILTIAVAVLPLLGVVLGHRLSRSWQREQWLLDQRVKEFRELLDALAEDLRVATTMHVDPLLWPTMNLPQAVVDAHSNAMRVMQSRIFIVKDLIRVKMEERWSIAVDLHRRTMQIEPLARTFTELRILIVNAARQNVPRPWFKRILDWRKSKRQLK